MNGRMFPQILVSEEIAATTELFHDLSLDFFHVSITYETGRLDHCSRQSFIQCLESGQLLLKARVSLKAIQVSFVVSLGVSVTSAEHITSLCRLTLAC